MSKRKKDSNTAGKIGRSLELSGGMLEGGVHTEIFSNNEVVVDGIKGVIEYSDFLIKLNMGKGVMEFWGSDLEISSLSAYGLTITGNITKLEFVV